MAGAKRAAPKAIQRKPRISRWAADGLSAFEDAAGPEAIAEVKKTLAEFVAWASTIHKDSPPGTVSFLRKMIEAYEDSGKTAACFATKEFLSWVSTCLGLFQTFYLEVKEASIDHLYNSTKESADDSEGEALEAVAAAKEEVKTEVKKETPTNSEDAPHEKTGAKIHQWKTLGIDAFERQSDHDLQRVTTVINEFKTWMTTHMNKSQNAATDSGRHVERLFFVTSVSLASMATDEYFEWGKEVTLSGDLNISRHSRPGLKLFQTFYKDVMKESNEHLYRAGPTDGSVGEQKKVAAQSNSENVVAESKIEKGTKQADSAMTSTVAATGPALISQWEALGLDAFEQATSADDEQITILLEEFRSWLTETHSSKSERSLKDNVNQVGLAYRRTGRSIASFCTDELIEWGRSLDPLGQFNFSRHVTGSMRLFQTFLVEQKQWSHAHLYNRTPAGTAEATLGGRSASSKSENGAAPEPKDAKRKALAAGEAETVKKQRADDSETAPPGEHSVDEDAGLVDGANEHADGFLHGAEAGPKKEADPSKPRILQWQTLGIEAFNESSEEDTKAAPEVFSMFKTWILASGKSISTARSYTLHLEKDFLKYRRAVVYFATDEFHNWGKGADAQGAQRLQPYTLCGMKLFQVFYREQKDTSALDNLYKLP